MEQLSASMGAWCAQFSNPDKLHAERSTFRASLLNIVKLTSIEFGCLFFS
jgi:hypothetical protein